MLTTFILASVWSSGVVVEAPIQAVAHEGAGAPFIQLWTDGNDVYRRGDRVRVYFETDVDAYVTVFQVDTDGRVRVRFPLDPWDDNYARGSVRYQIESRHGGHSFRVDDYPGQGYLFAVASADPFRYARYARADHWDYPAMADHGRVTGDPYVALGDMLDAIVPPNYVAYSYDAVAYYVERRYDYPRFLCYDCHTYATWPRWDPYAHSCFQFRIVIYDDPYYYPARSHAGTRVVYRRPAATVPRFVFKDRTPDDDYVVRRTERPVDTRGRRRIEPGATRRTLSGGSRVPAPVQRERIRPAWRPDGRMATPPDRARPTKSRLPRLERRDPRRAVPRAGDRRNRPRRAQPARAPTRRATPRRADPKRNAPPRRNGPKRRRN